MEIIAHRINKISTLKSIPKKYGVEIDLRANGSKIILNHEPKKNGDSFRNYIENYNHGTLVLNIKEAGIEKEVIKLVKKNKIKSYFLLDVEMPYLYSVTRKKKFRIAVRFSEYENIDIAKFFVNKAEWVWIDTVTKIPINKNNIQVLKKFKSCLVCPERWGRKKDIFKYKKIMNKFNFKPNAVMTNISYAKMWEEF